MNYLCKWKGPKHVMCGETDPAKFHSEGVHDPYKYSRCSKHRTETAKIYATRKHSPTFDIPQNAIDLMRRRWGKSKIADMAYCTWKYGH